MLEEIITKDYILAMKEKDPVKVSTLSFLRASLKNALIDKKQSKLEDADVVAVIKKQVKQRQDSIGQFEKGGRTDLVEKEKKELQVLKSYLPEEMPEEELKALIEKAIAESEATSIKDMGKVMKILLPQIAGKADNKMASDLVREKLTAM